LPLSPKLGGISNINAGRTAKYGENNPSIAPAKSSPTVQIVNAKTLSLKSFTVIFTVTIFSLPFEYGFTNLNQSF